MPTLISTLTHARYLYTASFLFILLGLPACASTPSASLNAETPAVTASASTDANKSNDPKSRGTATEIAFVSPEPATKEPAMQPEKTKAVRIDVSCKNEPYSKYEKQSRASIAKGLSATTAGTYGVGFRDLKEHKRWSKTHNALFKAANKACSVLSKCAKKHPKDKTKQCAQQAEHFAQWQELSAQFAKKAKQSETTQPPKICSFTPNLADAAMCFHALGDNVDKACTSSDCKETSDCWRGIGFLDYAINQAVSACKFSRMALSECRGYTTATQRREAKFERCTQMQKGLNVRVIPVL
jgi:hypothetical protein